MLKISDVSTVINDFIKSENTIRKGRIFVRANFALDVHIVSEDVNAYDKYYFKESFKSFLKKNEKSFEFDDFRIFFKVYSVNEHDDDEYVACLFTDNVEYKQLEASSRFRLNSYFQNMPVKKVSNDIPIVTFYSYKGGMGRTTTMISYAIDLAVNQDKKVFVIDCDLEAPGYLNFFNLSKHQGLVEGKVNGLVEFLCDCSFTKNTDVLNIGDYCINVSAGNEDKEAALLQNIYIMPAGNLNEKSELDGDSNRTDYLEGLSRLNLSDEQTLVEGFGTLISKVKEVIGPDIILIDSRTGFNDIIGTATMYLSDMVVGFFGFNEQTVPGIFSLLDNYYKSETNYKLQIVSSILPMEGASELVDNERNLILRYIQNNYANVKKDIPSFLTLHRTTKLEVLGTNKSTSTDYVEIIRRKEFNDYNDIFESLNSILKTESTDTKVTVDNSYGDLDNSEFLDKNGKSHSNKKTIELRNTILRKLKTTLSSVYSFAENTDITEKVFFYRECMNDFFDEEKFLIRGYKGTGKTYMYKALADPNLKKIAETIIKRANSQRIGTPKITYTPKFIDIISIEGGNKMFDFTRLGIGRIEDPDYFFNAFWQIHTWNSILLDEEFTDIRDSSKLSDYIKDIKGSTPIRTYNELIESGIDVLIEIENDLDKVNDYLEKKGKKLFILFDQLDTRINPKYWDKVVSPLIAYWREKWNYYKNIIPKIFVRTDLFNNNLRGTNTARLSENIINIEWKIEEIFAYFFKLIFSNPESAKAFWIIATERIGLNHHWVEDTQKQFAESDNQFKHVNRSSMMKAVTIFFGTKVTVNGSDLGNPWDYFLLNLANADNNSISIRPFINTLDGNAIDLALKKTIQYGYVKEILPPEIYASREVRIKAANEYYSDLAKDTSLHDLLCVKDFINSEKGKDYRLKTLDESQFEEFVNKVYDQHSDTMTSTNSAEDLKSLLFGCGIMAFYPVRGGKLYKFAPMYVYAWGLKDTRFDKELSFSKNNGFKRPKNFTGKIEYDGEDYHCRDCLVSKIYVENNQHCGKTIQWNENDIDKSKNSKYKYYIKKYDVIN